MMVPKTHRSKRIPVPSYLHCPISFSPFLTLTHLSLCAPDALDQTITLSQAVQRIVRLAHGTDEAAKGVDVVLAGDSAARLVNLGDRDLNGGVVLGLNDAVGGRALAGDVAIREKSSGSAHCVRSWSLFASQYTEIQPKSIHSLRVAYRSTISPRSFSILTAGYGNWLNLGDEAECEGQKVVNSSVSKVDVLQQFAEFGLPLQFLCGVARALTPPSQLAPCAAESSESGNPFCANDPQRRVT